ncbi:MAG: hypothetical protein P4L51_12300 [Puia sp.]|nr:hypothetical protein [Puia sp.]
MKTSNKLILFFFISAVAIFGAIHLALFANYRKGAIHTRKEIEQARLTRFPMQTPKWLSLKGHLHVTIIPSDSFYIELNKDFEGVGYSQEGDSLVITGILRGDRNPHGSWNEYWNLPPVNVYSPGLDGIRAENCYLALSNEKDKPGLAASVLLKNAQLWIGAFDPIKDSVFGRETFDSLFIDEVNSNVGINRQSVVHSISVRLDDVSEIIDRFSRIDTGEIAAGRYSKICMTAANFNRIRVGLTAEGNAGRATGPWKQLPLSIKQSVIVGLRDLNREK